MSTTKIDFEAIGNRIKALRKDKESTQESFGKLLGMRRQDIHAIETGKRQAGLTILYRISLELNVSLDFLVLGRENTTGGEAVVNPL